jgi:hypothetical protein
LLILGDLQCGHDVRVLIGLSTRGLNLDLLQAIALCRLQNGVELGLELLVELLHGLGHLFARLGSLLFGLILATEAAARECRSHLFTDLITQCLDVADLLVGEIQIFLHRLIRDQREWRTVASTAKSTTGAKATTRSSTLPTLGTLSKRHRGTQQNGHHSDPSKLSKHERFSFQSEPTGSTRISKFRPSQRWL